MCRKVLILATRLAALRLAALRLAALGLLRLLGLGLATPLTLRLVKDELSEIGHTHLPSTLCRGDCRGCRGGGCRSGRGRACRACRSRA